MKPHLIRLPILLALTVLLAACASSRMKPVARHEVGRGITGSAAIGQHALAIGGVIADESMHLTAYPGDPAANAETMLVLLQGELGNRRLVAETMLSDLVMPETLAAIRSQYARTGSVDPFDLQRMGRELVGVERLMMARVEMRGRGVRVGEFRLTRDSAGEVQAHPLGSESRQGITSHRNLRVTLDVWDLVNGSHLWSVTTMVREIRPGSDDSPTELEAATSTSRWAAPRRSEVLDEALNCLIKSIGKRPKGARIKVPARRDPLEDPLR